MATKCTNIFQNPAIKNNAEKGRYSDPLIPGMGSPYNKKGWKTNYKQTASQTATFGPGGTNPNPEIYAGIVKEAKKKPNSPKEAHCK